MSLQHLHETLGHDNYADCLIVAKENNIKLSSHDKVVCESCLTSKSRRAHIHIPTPEEHHQHAPGTLIHCDIKPIQADIALENQKYTLVFLEASSHYGFIYPMAKKNEAAHVLDLFMKDALNAGIIIPRGAHVQCDDDPVLVGSGDFLDKLYANGLVPQSSPPYTPEMNGVIERYIGVITDMARTMITAAQLKPQFTSIAMQHAVWLRNRLPTSVLGGKSPYQQLTGKIPNMSNLHIFGEDAYVHVDNSLRKSTEAKARRGTFVGYDNSVGYRIVTWDTLRLIESIHVHFDGSHITHVAFQAEDPTDSSAVRAPLVKIAPPPPSTTPVLLTTVPTDNSCPELLEDNESCTQPEHHPPLPAQTATEPRSLKQAMKLANAPVYDEAYHVELNTLRSNGTYKLVPISSVPKGQHILRSVTVFKAKHDSEGNFLKMKARITADGSKQVQGIDYAEAFTPVVHTTTVRTLAAISVLRPGYAFLHSDFSSAFLQGDMVDGISVFMYPPELELQFDSEGNQLVCEILKPLYGLRQASRQWYTKLHEALTELGFVRSHIDPCLYRHNSEQWLCFHVDDMLFLGDPALVAKTVKALHARFKMTDLGPVSFYLGISFNKQTPDSITLSQPAYAQEILTRFGMTDSKPSTTPLDARTELPALQPGESPLPSEYPFGEAVGCLNYLVTMTRPELSHSVSQLARHIAKPVMRHWVALKRVLRYVKGTIHSGITYHAVPQPSQRTAVLHIHAHPSYTPSMHIQGYVDANWGSNPDNRRSTTGYVFTLAGGVISWKSKSQLTVALSSTESEYMALSAATQEALSLRELITFLTATSGPTASSLPALNLWEDNQGAIHVASNPVTGPRLKHIDIRHHFIREHIVAGEVSVSYIPTEFQLADIMTKNLERPRFQLLSAALQGVFASRTSALSDASAHEG